MCTYPLLLEESLVMRAESTLQIEENFQTWLQRQVEMWLLAQVNGLSHRAQPRHHGLSDEVLAEKLKDYPPLEEDSFPSLVAEDYSDYLKTSSGKLPKGIERWL